MYAQLLTAGFDLPWLTSEIGLHGPELEKLLLDGVSMGLTKGFMVELVSKLGAIGLQIIQDLIMGTGAGVHGVSAPMPLTKARAANILLHRVTQLIV